MYSDIICAVFLENKLVAREYWSNKEEFYEFYAANAHFHLAKGACVVIQLPSLKTIYLNQSGSEVIGKIIDASTDMPVVTFAKGKLGPHSWINQLPLAWTDKGELFIGELIKNNYC